MIKIRYILYVLIIVNLFFCKGREGIVGPKGTDLKGSLIGYALLHNAQGVEETINDSVLVKADGSTPLIFAYTDSRGKFELKNLPLGTYDILFEKYGYGYNKIMGYGFVGGTKSNYLLGLQRIHLIKFPLKNTLYLDKILFKGLKPLVNTVESGVYADPQKPITMLGINYISLRIEAHANETKYGLGSGIVLYFYNNSNVSSNRYDYIEFMPFDYFNRNKDSTKLVYGEISIPYKKQSKIYVKAYICNTCEWTKTPFPYQDDNYSRNSGFWTKDYQTKWNPNQNYSKYYDMDKNLLVPTALGDSSNVLSVDIP